jgi:hypothetical protein
MISAAKPLVQKVRPFVIATAAIGRKLPAIQRGFASPQNNISTLEEHINNARLAIHNLW